MQSTTFEDETELTYERHGTGQPILMLHGGMAPREYWAPVIPHFEEYAPVIPQRPGFGTCLDDLTETTADEVLDREVAYVRRLADTVDGDPIVLGHSFGALTAVEAARDAAVEAAIAYEPAVLPEAFRTEADLSERMARLIDDGEPEAAVKLYIEQVLHPDGVDDLDAWLADWPVWPRCVELADEVVRMNRAVEQYQLPPTLDVDVPVLVLSGTEGPDFLRESARAVHDALSQSRLVEFDSVSHSGPAEAPELVSAAVDTFMNTV